MSTSIQDKIKPFANLRGANLRGANLYEASLRGANLYEASLRGANLSGANLSEASLSGANLSGASLRGANLSGANLYGANLYGADLSEASLSGANLSGANLYEANLYEASLYGADLSEASLRGALNIPQHVEAVTSIVPQKGSFIGYKKLRNGLIAELEVLPNAKRSNATGRKCRVSAAKVIRIFKNKKAYKSGLSTYDHTFVYKVGQIVRPKTQFDINRWDECSTGIHLFLTKYEAENY